MKLLSLFVCIIYFSQEAKAQSVQRVFNKGYANNISHCSDGGFIITGDLETNTNERIFLMKLDATGSIKWFKTYRNLLEFYSYGSVVTELPGEGFVFAGLILHDTISNEEISLMKCDTAGNLIWTKTYGNPLENDEAKSLVVLHDGFLLGGFTSGYGAGGEEFYLLKTDTAGHLLWTKTFGTSKNERGIALLPASGGFVFGGNGQEDSTTYNDICLTFLDSSFTMLHTIRLNAPGDQRLCDLSIDINGDFLIAATTDSGSGSVHSLFIKLALNGNILWSNVLQGSGSAPCNIRTSTNGILACGKQITHPSGENGFIIQMDSSGNLISENYFGDSTGCALNAFLSDDDTILATGYNTLPFSLNKSFYLNHYILNDTACNHFTENNSFNTLTITIDTISWQTNTPATPETNAVVLASNVVSHDSLLCDFNAFTGNIYQNININISPNPADENTSVFIPGLNSKIEISIFDLIGTRLQLLPFSKQINFISTDNLPSGIYFVLIKNNSFIYTQKLIIQH